MQLDWATRTTLEQVRSFPETPPQGALAPSRAETYAQVVRTLRPFSYWKASKADKGLLRANLQRTTGFLRAQTARLMKAGRPAPGDFRTALAKGRCYD